VKTARARFRGKLWYSSCTGFSPSYFYFFHHKYPSALHLCILQAIFLRFISWFEPYHQAPPRDPSAGPSTPLLFFPSLVLHSGLKHQKKLLFIKKII